MQGLQPVCRGLPPEFVRALSAGEPQRIQLCRADRHREVQRMQQLRHHLSRRMHHRLPNQRIIPHSTHAERQRNTFAQGQRSHSTCRHQVWLRRLLWLPHHSTKRDSGNSGIAETLGNNRYGGTSERERGGKHQHDICRRRFGQVCAHLILQCGHFTHAGSNPIYGHLRSAWAHRICPAWRSRPWHHPTLAS